MSLSSSRRAIAPVLVALILGGTSHTVIAQQAQQPPAAASPEAAKAQALRGEIQSLRQELQQVQQATLENDSELQAQRQALVGLVQDKMAAADPEADQKVARIRTIQQKIQGGELTQDKQRELFGEFQQLQRKLQQTQQRVMQDPEVVEQQSEFQQAMTVAMVERDPAVETKLNELRELASEYQALQQES